MQKKNDFPDPKEGTTTRGTGLDLSYETMEETTEEPTDDSEESDESLLEGEDADDDL